MNFWATRLGVNAPQQPQYVPQPAQQPAGVPVPWYANPYTVQTQQPAQELPQQSYPEQENQGWGSVRGSLAKAKSSKLSGTCPNCGSDNYFRPDGQPNAMEQCYGCGYNSRFSQTGGEGGMPSGESGPTQAARQLPTAGAGGASQFNPGNIIAHI